MWQENLVFPNKPRKYDLSIYLFDESGACSSL